MNELKRPSAKRLLAWLLAIVLCVGAIPADAVFAEPEAATGTQAQSEDAQSEDGAQPQEAGLEDAGGESAQAEDGQTEYQVTFVFSAADGFSYLGEEGGQTVRTVAEDGFITDVQEAYSNGTRNIVGWQDAETRENVSLSQPVTRDMTLHPILDQYHVWFSCYELDYGDMRDVPAGTLLSDLVPELEEKEHYTFEYWYLSGVGDKAFDFDGIKADRDYYFSGKVSRDFTYRATLYLATDFEEYEAQGIIKYADENAMLEKPVYENGNRTVIGWKELMPGVSGEEFDFSQPLTRDVQLYPIYDNYRLQFSAETVYAEAGKILTDVPKGEDRDHETFKGWEGWDPESGDYKLFNFSTEPITQDQMFQAAYDKDYAYKVDFAWVDGFDDKFDFETQYLKEGAKPEKPPVLDNGSRKIIGWTTTWGSREEYDFDQEVTEDLYLCPIYDKYRVIFRGDDLYETVYVPVGEKLANVPKEESYDEHFSFGGWSYYGYNEETEEWEDIKFDFANTPITQDCSFDVIWDRNFAYEVRIYYNSVSDFKNCFAEDNIGGIVTLYLQEGEKLDPLPEYDNGNRKIIGWTMKKNGRALYDFDQEVTEDISLYPVTDKCRLRFGKETRYVDYNTVFPQEELEKIPNPEEREHYTFIGWNNTKKGMKAFDFTQPIRKDYKFIEIWKQDFDGIVYLEIGEDFYDYAEKNHKETEQYIKLSENNKIDDPGEWDNGSRKIIGWTKQQGSQDRYNFSTPLEDDGEYFYISLYPIYDKPMVTFYDFENIYEWRQDVYVTPGQTVTPPAGVQDPYYTFKGWGSYDEDENFVNFDFQTSITEDITLYAEWEPNFYNIYFYNTLDDAEVLSWPRMPGRVIKGKTAAGLRQQVGDPVVKGHYFAGWYYDEECTKPFSENTVLTKSIGLYAKWGTNSDGSSVTPGNGNEAKVTSVTLSATSLVIPKGKSQALTVTTAPLKNAAVTWSSSDNSVATVNGGTVMAKKAGEATITATAAGGVRASCKVTVAEVKLNASSAELKTKQSSTALKIESKYPKNDTVASWKSSNPKVVKVDKKGKITADKKTGTAVITVTMKSGTTATCKVTVKKKAVKTKKLTMNVKKLAMKKGKSVSLSVMRDPITATEKIKWSSSNKKVATVTSNGKVKAKKKGKATITAKSSNGKKATCKITVK